MQYSKPKKNNRYNYYIKKNKIKKIKKKDSVRIGLASIHVTCATSWE